MRRAGTRLLCTYRLAAPPGSVHIPSPGGPHRADGLWRHTCLEAFVAPAGAAAYWEVNLSPGGGWNVYRFLRPREGMTPERRLAAPPAVRIAAPDAGTLEVAAALDLAGIPEVAATDLDVGLAAVLAHPGGAYSYWALRHAGDRPDFHRRESFLLHLGRGADG